VSTGQAGISFQALIPAERGKEGREGEHFINPGVKDK